MVLAFVFGVPPQDCQWPIFPKFNSQKTFWGGSLVWSCFNLGPIQFGFSNIPLSSNKSGSGLHAVTKNLKLATRSYSSHINT